MESDMRMPVRHRPWWILWASFGFAAATAVAVSCAGTPPCEKNSDCPEKLYCEDGECTQECDPDLDSQIDCDQGEVCNLDGQCVDTSAGGGGQGGSGTGGGTGGSGTGTASGTGSGTGTGTGTGTGAPTLGELDNCASGTCASPLVCKELTKGGFSRCTRSCSSNSDCPAGTRCIDDGSGSHCLGDDIGRFCADANPCNFACITGPNHCTAPCASGSDCPNGYGCMAVGGTDVCVRAEALCDGNDTSQCVVPAACDLSPNLILGGCTLACDAAADCPRRAAPLAPWTCDGLCRRPADVYGPLPGGWKPTEWHCAANQPVVLCNDAQHIDFATFTLPATPNVDCNSGMTTTGAANDSCLNSCRYQGGCSFGYGCAALGGVANERIGLCLPAGPKEVGQPCAGHSECAFAYCANGVCSRDCTADGVCPSSTSCVAGGSPNVEGATFRRCE